MADFGNLVWDLLEASSLGIEQWVFNELQEKICQSLSEALQRTFWAASIEHVGLAINQLDDLSS